MTPFSMIFVLMVLRMQSLSASSTPSESSKGIQHGQSCTVNTTNFTIEVETVSDNETIITTKNFSVHIDPCNQPKLRKFMHCNTKTSKCECYRDWRGLNTEDEFHIPKPDYINPDKFDLAPEWFVYESGHSANECVVMKGKRCGRRNEFSPYRCHPEGRCSEFSDEDEEKLTYFCSRTGSSEAGALILVLSTIIIILHPKLFVKS